jgi:molybdopterin synthase sulfur carrier subunit
MVTIHILGLTLRDSVGESELECDVAQPTTVKKLIESNQDRLNDLLPFLNRGEVLVTVNKKVGTLESVIKDGDTLRLAHQSNPVYEGARWQNP